MTDTKKVRYINFIIWLFVLITVVSIDIHQIVYNIIPTDKPWLNKSCVIGFYTLTDFILFIYTLTCYLEIKYGQKYENM